MHVLGSHFHKMQMHGGTRTWESAQLHVGCAISRRLTLHLLCTLDYYLTNLNTGHAEDRKVEIVAFKLE
jgi:hypothetical protein